MKRIIIIISAIFLIILNCKKDTKEVDPGMVEESAIPETPKTLPQQVISKKDSSHMVLIPEGNFIYGIKKTERDSILNALSNAILNFFELEFPEQVKNLPSYYIDKYEVTNRQYAKFIEVSGHRTPEYWGSRLYNHPQQPVVGVGWEDAKAYAKWAGKRLPIEEEWEKAARGTDGRFWPWGNDPSGEKYNGKVQGNYSTVGVGSFPEGASPYGVMDMAGNVYEMTTGIWGSSAMAMRGGSYLNAGAYTRTMFRWAMDDEANGAPWLGFRCVMDTSMIQEMAMPIQQ
jgi:formylglycine-generating enzyme required for sulfatase activity